MTAVLVGCASQAGVTMGGQYVLDERGAFGLDECPILDGRAIPRYLVGHGAVQAARRRWSW